jgi:hypothetical protein
MNAFNTMMHSLCHRADHLGISHLRMPIWKLWLLRLYNSCLRYIGPDCLAVEINPRQISPLYLLAVCWPQAWLDLPAVSVIYASLVWPTSVQPPKPAVRYRAEQSTSLSTWAQRLQPIHVLQTLAVIIKVLGLWWILSEQVLVLETL